MVVVFQACDLSSDTQCVMEQFNKNVLSTVVDICGPYAFVYWNRERMQLWFGRDVCGRKSLLWTVSENCLGLTSVAHKNTQFSEVPALGVYMLDLSLNEQVGNNHVVRLGLLF